jgi:hypothetical protein
MEAPPFLEAQPAGLAWWCFSSADGECCGPAGDSAGTTDCTGIGDGGSKDVGSGGGESIGAESLSIGAGEAGEAGGNGARQA